jgi:hypothetical protein
MSVTVGLVKAIEAYVEERLKELAKKLEYDEDETTELMEAIQRWQTSKSRSIIRNQEA